MWFSINKLTFWIIETEEHYTTMAYGIWLYSDDLLELINQILQEIYFHSQGQSE